MTPKQSSISRLFKRTPYTRAVFFIASDIILILASVYLSYLLRFDFNIPAHFQKNIPIYFILVVVTVIPIFYLKGLYRFTWIYVSLTDLIKIFRASVYALLFAGLIFFIGRNHPWATNLPRSVIILSYSLIFILTTALRVSKRIYFELWNKSATFKLKPAVLIIGAGDAAEQLIRSIKHNPEYPFRIAGILDDSDLKQHTTIHNIAVLGKINQLPKIKKIYQIEDVIISMPSASTKKIQEIIDMAQRAGITKIKTLPTLINFYDRKIDLRDVRDIEVEDLLGREVIDVSLTEIQSLINGKVILITGASGSIGFDLVKKVANLSPQSIIALDMDETGIYEVEKYLSQKSSVSSYRAIVGNILNKSKIEGLFQQQKIDLVFHAAAYKHVKIMERHPEEAVLNNILGTWNLAEIAAKYQTEKFILISTDKAVNPTSVMGMTKRAAELLINYYNHHQTKFLAVRFGNVLGSRGSVVPLFKKQIRTGGPVTVTHPDMQRYFMLPSEATLLVLQAAGLGQGGELFVLDMGEPIKIMDLAKTMIKLAGYEPYKDIPIVFTHPESGEKLFEEILSNKENMLVTKNKKIFITPQSFPGDKDQFFADLNKIIELAKAQAADEIKPYLVKIIS